MTALAISIDLHHLHHHCRRWRGQRRLGRGRRLHIGPGGGVRGTSRQPKPGPVLFGLGLGLGLGSRLGFEVGAEVGVGATEARGQGQGTRLECRDQSVGQGRG